MSVQVEFDWEIEESLNNKLNTEKIKTAMKKAITQEAIDMRDAIKDVIEQTAYDTGNMKRNEVYEVNSNDDTIEFLIKNGEAPYWVYVNYGTYKMSARNFVQTALNNEQPAKKVAENFKSFYKT